LIFIDLYHLNIICYHLYHGIICQQAQVLHVPSGTLMHFEAGAVPILFLGQFKGQLPTIKSCKIMQNNAMMGIRRTVEFLD
jgi:hypothetical protein